MATQITPPHRLYYSAGLFKDSIDPPEERSGLGAFWGSWEHPRNFAESFYPTMALNTTSEMTITISRSTFTPWLYFKNSIERNSEHLDGFIDWLNTNNQVVLVDVSTDSALSHITRNEELETYLDLLGIESTCVTVQLGSHKHRVGKILECADHLFNLWEVVHNDTVCPHSKMYCFSDLKVISFLIQVSRVELLNGIWILKPDDDLMNHFMWDIYKTRMAYTDLIPALKRAELERPRRIVKPNEIHRHIKHSSSHIDSDYSSLQREF